jgi:hypothetical protein
MELASFSPSDAWNIEVATRFQENVDTPGLHISSCVAFDIADVPSNTILHLRWNYLQPR